MIVFAPPRLLGIATMRMPVTLMMAIGKAALNVAGAGLIALTPTPGLSSGRFRRSVLELMWVGDRNRLRSGRSGRERPRAVLVLSSISRASFAVALQPVRRV